jgi:RNA polymerase sigma factor (sigma-70 family)
MNIRELFEVNLAVIDRVIAGVCRRGGLKGADAQDFAAATRLALIDDDYAILRGWKGHSALATYLTIIVQRFLADERIRTYGRWHSSAEARRLGEVAMRLEMLLVREQRPMSEAVTVMCGEDPSLTAEQLEETARRLPLRAPRLRAVDSSAVDEEKLVAGELADAPVLQAEQRRLAVRTGHVLRQAIEALPLEERTILRLHYASQMSIADIARVLQVPQRPLYRRLELLIRGLRKVLDEAGIEGREVLDLIGAPHFDIAFGLEPLENGERMENRKTGQTKKEKEARP